MSRVVGLSLVVFIGVQAPSTSVINDVESCAGCRISLRIVHSFPVPDWLCVPWSLAWTGSHYVLAPGCTPGEVLLLTPDGSVEGRLGATGQGPGERDRVLAIASDAHGRLIVYSWSRVQVYSGETLVVDRRAPVRLFPRDLAFVSDQHFIVASTSLTRSRAGMTLHVFDTEGERVDSIAPEQRWSADADQLAWRNVTPGSDGSFWSAKRFGNYELEKWSVEGERLASYRREPSPFTDVAWNSQNAPSLRDIRDHDGLLWTLTWVRSPPEELDRLPEARPPSQGPMPLSATRSGPSNAVHLRNDTIIEVVNPAAEKVVARHRITDALRGFFLGDSLRAWTYRENENEESLAIEVFDVTIDRTP